LRNRFASAEQPSLLAHPANLVFLDRLFDLEEHRFDVGQVVVEYDLAGQDLLGMQRAALV